MPQIRNERQFVRDIGGQSTAGTLEASANQQILKWAKQRKEQLSIEDLRSILAATSSRQTAETSKAQLVNTAAVQTDAAPQAGNSTKSAVLTECCATADVPARLRYSKGSFPNSCPVSGKPFAQDTAVGRAVSQQQQTQLVFSSRISLVMHRTVQRASVNVP